MNESLRPAASRVIEIRATLLLAGASAAASVALGYGAATLPWVVLGLLAASAVTAFSLAVPGALPRMFLLLMAVLLFGYAFFGRAFAYLGAAPVYVGELVLGVGVCAALTCRRPGALRHPLWLLLAMFMTWGAVRTWPYLADYRSFALRDAVIWGYALFAVCVGYLLHGTRLIPDIAARTGVMLRWLVLWAPLVVLIGRAYGSRMPTVLGTDVPILSLKAGDAAVHLAGAAAFMLLRLDRTPRGSVRERARRSQWMWWSAWAIGALVVASISRGGFLAISLALAVVAALRPAEVGRRLANLILAASLVILLLAALDVSIDLGSGRRISPQQVVQNVASITQGESVEELEGSRRWRLLWWGEVVDYTFRGDYFWTGKGFGINLANADGFQVYADESLRSPHNAPITLLARAGVPGLVIWIVLQVSFALWLLFAAIRARQRQQYWWMRLDIWILAYWMAFTVNGAFDVYLEGPQGGIWFWALFGFGIAALQAQRVAGDPVGAQPMVARYEQRIPDAHGRGSAAVRPAR